MTIQVGKLTNGSDDFYPVTHKDLVEGLYPDLATSQPAGGMLPNIVYNLGVLTSTTTFLMAVAEDDTIANIWHWTFTTGNVAPTIIWPEAIIGWYGTETAPTINANCHYEVSVMDGIGIIMEVAI